MSAEWISDFATRDILYRDYFFAIYDRVSYHHNGTNKKLLKYDITFIHGRNQDKLHSTL